MRASAPHILQARFQVVLALAPLGVAVDSDSWAAISSTSAPRAIALARSSSASLRPASARDVSSVASDS